MKKENMELDLKKLLYNFLKKWYITIIVMVIMAVCSNIFYIYQKNDEVKNNIEKYEESLTKKEQLEVEYAHEKYELYNEQYEQKNTYLNNSMKMNINAEQEFNYLSQYYIQTTNGSAENIASAYIRGLENQELYDAIEKALDGKVKSAYVSELISVWQENSTDSVSVDNHNAKVFNVNVIGESEEDCKNIISEIQKRIDTIYSETQQIYGSYNLTNVFTNSMVIDDSNLRTQQSSLQDELVTIKKNMYEVTKSLTTVQKEYYNAKYPLEEVKEKSNISVKFIVLGLGVGFVLCLIISAARYILQKRLRAFNELKQGWNLTLLGNPIVLKPKKSFDEFLDSKLNNNVEYKPYNEQITRIASEITMLLNKNNMNNIILTGTANTDEVNNSIKDIVKELKKHNIQAKASSSIVTDTQAMMELENVEAVVIVEQIMKTMYIDIDREIELCQRADKKVLGAVVIAD